MRSRRNCVTPLFVIIIFATPSFAWERPPHAHPALKEGMKLQELQNKIADEEGMRRYKNRGEVEDASSSCSDAETPTMFCGELVRIRENRWISIDNNLPVWRRVSQPQTEAFLQDFGEAYTVAKLGGKVVVNSATRDIETQLAEIESGNPNAAEIEGPKASSHPTGASLDLAKKKMSRKGVRWSIRHLDLLQKHGFVVYANERKRRAVLHVFVSKTYTAGTLQRLIAEQQKQQPPKPHKPQKKKNRRSTRR